MAMVATPLGLGVARWWRVYQDLNRPERLTAWAEIQRTGTYDLAKTARDPRAVRLWLAVGRDPNGHDCARWGQRPSALDLAVLRPLGMCEPDSSASMPFVHASLGGYSADAAEAMRLMIAAGVDVNEASPDGLLPLQNAVVSENVVLVQMLLSAGADPLRRPAYSQIGDLDNALEVAARKPRTPAAIRVEEMLRRATTLISK
jgi:hypothetical protein